MKLQKEMISNQKQPSCKKRVRPPKKARVKKDVKSKVAARNGCDGRLMAKNFNNDNSGRFGAEF